MNNTCIYRRVSLLVGVGVLALLPLMGCGNKSEEATDTASPAAASANVPAGAAQDAAGQQAAGQQNGRNAAANAAAFNAARAKAEGH